MVVTQTDGSVVEGIFHTFTPFPGLPPDQRNMVVLKEVRTRPPSKAVANGGSGAAAATRPGKGPAAAAAAVPFKDGATLVLPASRVVLLHAKDVVLNRPTPGGGGAMNGGPASANHGSAAALASLGTAAVSSSSDGAAAFVTDTQISAAKGGKDRDLVAAGSAWTAGPTSAASAPNSNNSSSNIVGRSLGGGLQQPPINSRAAALAGVSSTGPTGNTNNSTNTSNTSSRLAGSIGEWDQFKANQELFNVNATFDENLYTTQLDKSQMDGRRIAEAERLAREIEGTVTTNIHLAEERGFQVETDFDEEDLYSGVLLTEDGKQRHEGQQPLRRGGGNVAAPAGAASKAGAPAKGDASTTAPAAAGPPPALAPPKKMNYAAAAAKADAGKKAAAAAAAAAAPPGFVGNKGPSPPAPSSSSAAAVGAAATRTAAAATPSPPAAAPPSKESKDGIKAAEAAPVTADERKPVSKVVDQRAGGDKAKSVDKEKSAPLTKGQEEPAQSKKAVEKAEAKAPPNEESADPEPSNDANEEKKEKMPSKLNANAKSFSFNPSAKSFTPSFGGTIATPPSSSLGGPSLVVPQPQQHMMDPNMPIFVGPPHMQPPHYMSQQGELSLVSS